MRRALAAGIALALAAGAAHADEYGDGLSDWLRWELAQEVTTHALRTAIRGDEFRSGSAPGSGQLVLPGSGRIDLTAPGSITLTIVTERWRVDGDYVPLIAVLGRGGATFLIERDRPAPGAGERMLIGFFGLRGGIDVSLTAAFPRPASADAATQLAVSWDNTGFAAAVGTAPFVRRALPSELAREAFASTATQLVIGGIGSEAARIRSLRVYRRALETP